MKLSKLPQKNKNRPRSALKKGIRGKLDVQRLHSEDVTYAQQGKHGSYKGKKWFPEVKP